mgnify:CR=1 FL=1
MKKSLYSLFAVLAIFCACQDENSQLGKSLVESSFYNVYADTCSVDISTILLDSIETPGRQHLPAGTLPEQRLGRSVRHLLCRILHVPLHPQHRPHLYPRLPCAADDTFGPFLGRYPDTTAHLHLPAEKPHRTGQRRGPLQQHRTPHGRCPTLQLCLHPPSGAEEGSKRPPARLMGTTTAERPRGPGRLLRYPRQVQEEIPPDWSLFPKTTGSASPDSW